MLAFYSLWYRTNQTSLQIEIQQEQIDTLTKQKDADYLISELKWVTEKLFELIYEQEEPPRQNILNATKAYLNSRQINPATGFRFDHDFVNKLTTIKIEGLENLNIQS
ncbi:hypothetical protein J8M20_01195 [Pseudoalteromonas luteoviolacea]|uniref:hypothetical protein n=1 Tax=Pseudoalteromonas luteoviolacea TaxID=43657 RepID=UPI001B388A44|nr:hypothetical protein [Pseudoalteromonas luteoviolacea]MBQ4809923.1 hypothetical protein [Pseudoalteromonas luteoviolacea]